MAVTSCRTCGGRIDFRTVSGKPKPYDVDSLGRVARPHTCHGSATAPASAPAPDPDAIYGGRGVIAGIDDIFAELSRADAEDAERERRRNEPKHEAIDWSYRPESSENGAVPAIDREFMIDRTQLAAIQRVIAMADRGVPQNVGLRGEAGSGKTSLGQQIGAIRRAPTFVYEMSQLQSADEAFGQLVRDASGESFSYRPSLLVRGIETPGSVVLLNDVANLQSRTVQNGLNDLLDPSTRGTFVEQIGRRVIVAQGVIIVGSWNEGGAYAAQELSAQILDRFRAGALFEVPFPSNGTLAHILRARTGVNEPNAARLANLADWLRGDPTPIMISTRGLIAAARQIVEGASVGEALACTLFGDLESAERVRAFTIIDVQLGAMRADDIERDRWSVPAYGDYVSIAEAAKPEADSATASEG